MTRLYSIALTAFAISALSFSPSQAAPNNGGRPGIPMGDLINNGFSCKYAQAGIWICTKAGEPTWYCQEKDAICTPNRPLIHKQPLRIELVPGGLKAQG